MDEPRHDVASKTDTEPVTERSVAPRPSRNAYRSLRWPLLPLLLAAGVVAGAIVALRQMRPTWPRLADHEFTVSVDDADSGGDASREQADDNLERRFAASRKRMVELQLRGRDITDSQVLAAMNKVPRHRFVPQELRPVAYIDSPLPIGEGQTISQPYIVGLMTQLARPRPNKKALDVGTGSGYQAAVLAETCDQVYSIEIIDSLARSADKRLEDLGYKNITVRHGDGYRGWKEQAPFDLVIVAAAPGEVPEPLIEQLAVGGRLVIPVGSEFWQTLLVIEKKRDGTIDRRHVAPVAFVPMTGEAERKD
jgi:protein-L-isoaspartate(D-aspartate) O-methyltransferase